MLAVQRLEHAPVDHLPRGEVQRRQASPGPPACRFPALVGRGKVVIEPAGGLGPGARADLPPRVRRVEPGVDLQHDGHACGALSRAGGAARTKIIC